MQIEAHIANRIVRNILLSILLYALPVVLMLLSFYISGERPWEKKATSGQVSGK
ncbi:hypothetical protein [Ohtaekwangia sp.]|uniref:hypothetical protein n=1 Tax=Ohtaekwangia sp. TaxID=2066019 RepID=UPI002FDD6FE5